MNTALMAQLKSVDEKQLQQMIKDNVVVIDIRTQEEYKQYGIIKGSYKITFFDQTGQYNIDNWLGKFNKLVISKEQPFVLVCAHANRTKMVGNMLSSQAKYTNVYELEGGINYGWIDKGLDTVK